MGEWYRHGGAYRRTGLDGQVDVGQRGLSSTVLWRGRMASGEGGDGATSGGYGRSVGYF
jgi:hypothetical protein